MLQRIGLTGLGVVFAVLYWPLEAGVHAFLFDDRGFLNSLFSDDLHEIWMRTIISLTFVCFGWLAQRGVNQQHEFQQRLHRKRDRLHNIIDHAYDAYVSMDENGKIIDWNRSAETLFGWQMNEVVGHPLAEIIIPEQQREAHYKGLKHYKESSAGPWLYKPVYTQALHRDGSEIVVEMVVTPLRSGGAQEFFAFIRKKSN